MAEAEDTYVITLKRTHLEWGTFRFTGSRNQIYGEGYIPIPRHIACRYRLLNSNGTGYRDIFGENLFNCVSTDGLFKSVLRSQGCKKAGDIYGKQFAGDKNLKALGFWFSQIDAVVGDCVRVTWISPTDIVIEKL